MDDKIYALDDQLVILLRRISCKRSRLAHIVVRGGHLLQMEIDVWRNKALSMKRVHVRATDKLDHGASRENRGSSVQSCIVPTDCGDSHVPGRVLGPAFAQKSSFLSLILVVKQTLL